MKKIAVQLALGLIFSNFTLFAQDVKIPSDSIETVLCKKWEADYALLGGMKISQMPGATDMIIEFKNDKTFQITSNNQKESTKGIWNYDSKKKLINLLINGKSNSAIISLNDNVLIMLIDTKEATPDDPMPMKVIYKVKTK